ncbi:MAG: hypothetical protein UV82_C0003G0016 [Candidatus Magasanikbacteria bacterium GW2011_GWD2_43_18]|uniref:Uncharacterized protein n=1 Tax=Candidatus Magasanikbacteria bacterium GW2011_GWE2_42_7 TaxID=1619052 RepID=A0A0G1BFM7_9BACT|nr:MAG: hypothetical protein UV18_C0006G0001 [Candidatus Magasanikbacteria bacterium GW2011_GWC2_42_27]KKS72190.1 MAG: hypothetical protein UV42_C0012G0017 [Candidatus Magasanikbacteria bacterium GW2011_GWE2_42_7]KKT04917.1 MAG: hypothetical protein UV82_C0003G0016 [Candidatus Magasanikbacteria bacterium GW2011_GWD2_43_18]KKT25395.1 MAG: hypothetical protein UW10_C0008G0007 [Candidatus Magasanikbacteria bacterium GW2011_GWA2_43_9]
MANNTQQSLTTILNNFKKSMVSLKSKRTKTVTAFHKKIEEAEKKQVQKNIQDIQ